MSGWLVYSCCSHLEHRASVKRFVSLQFLNVRHSVRLLGRVISPSQGHYLTQTQNKHKQTSMPGVGFEPTIAASERAKTVHALDRAATVIGTVFFFCEAIASAATPGLLCQSRVIVKMIVEKQMECKLAGETEVLGSALYYGMWQFYLRLLQGQW
jgi:hypothetical protein